ncbi:TetR/AcrR family transcriptional regulator [Clostridium sp. 19966]|uniref:TetR/AcrR family transcriptional regulator n=1 Tax=Clostridium sp. 19966 TaxID=2768166 RepID=UPI0028E01E87|nr:TetR/AcrR family transcriptional regulator [Clostridium sp. 19966]MDT8717806.1 TetR/AcrR family transcriptional regulator [Clostridium sp. 19966]
MQYLKDDVREKILSSALIEFREHGYEVASMRGIASKAGIALGSTYRYFKNKEALFSALIEPVYSKIVKYLNNMQAEIDGNPCNASEDSVAYINEIYNKIIELVDEYSAEVVIIFNKSEGSKYENVRQEFVVMVNNILDKAFQEEILKEETNKIILNIFSHTIVDAVTLMLKENSNYTNRKLLLDRLLSLYVKDLPDRLIT